MLSKYVHENRNLLLTSDGIKTLKANYNTVKDDTILAWNMQKEHHMIVDRYANALKKHMKNLKVRIVIKDTQKDTQKMVRNIKKVIQNTLR